MVNRVGAHDYRSKCIETVSGLAAAPDEVLGGRKVGPGGGPGHPGPGSEVLPAAAGAGRGQHPVWRGQPCREQRGDSGSDAGTVSIDELLLKLLRLPKIVPLEKSQR